MAVPSILFVRGGPAVMRELFAEHERGYWSAAFDVLLQKHGWLDFECAEPDVLADPTRVAAYQVLIVAWLPGELWLPEYVETLRSFAGTLLLEGPLPDELLKLAGAARNSMAAAPQDGPLQFGPAARDYIEQRFGSSFYVGHREPDPFFVVGLGADDNPLRLMPKRVVTRPPGFSRDIFAGRAPTVQKQVGLAAAALLLAYRARFKRQGAIFEDQSLDALGVLFCVRCLRVVRGRSFSATIRKFVTELLESSVQTELPAAVAIRGIALVEASLELGKPELAQQAEEMLAEARFAGSGTPTIEGRASQALLSLLLLSANDPAARHDATAVAPFLGPATKEQLDRRDVVMVWVMIQLARLLEGTEPAPVAAATSWLDDVAAQLAASSPGVWPPALDGFTAPDLILVASALRARGWAELAERLYGTVGDALYDPENASFWNGRVRGETLERLSSRASGPTLALGLAGFADAIEVQDPADMALRAYTDEQVRAWAATPYRLEAAQVQRGEVDVSLALADGSLPLLWRSGNVLASSFQILAQLVHHHTMHPLDAPYAADRHVDTLVLEHLLFAMLARAMADQGNTAAVVGPWPWGIEYCATIRHDVDRVLSEEQFGAVFGLEESAGVAVTWFWLPDRLEPNQLEALHEATRHEIGLHCVRYGDKQEECSSVLAAAPEGATIVGEAYHGAGDSWLGHPSVREAVERGLLYTELVPTVDDWPYWSFPLLAADGRIEREPIVGITFNGSIDGKLGNDPRSQTHPGVYRQLLNHPDINYERLQMQIEQLPDGPRLDWTCEQVARWWKATHRREALKIVRSERGGRAIGFTLQAESELCDVELRIGLHAEQVSRVRALREGDTELLEWSALKRLELSGIRLRVSLPANTPVEIVIELVAGESNDGLESSAALAGAQ